MPSFSGRIKLSLLGAVTLWIFARTVFAMPVPVTMATNPSPSIQAASPLATHGFSKR